MFNTPEREIMETNQSPQRHCTNAARLAKLEKRKRSKVGATYPPLESITRPTVNTAAAAYYLCRQQQTLRVWACQENGPIRPVRINGRLAWSVATIRGLLGA
jgi:hypothetical protein